MSLLSGTLDALPIQHDIVGYILEPRTQMVFLCFFYSIRTP